MRIKQCSHQNEANEATKSKEWMFVTNLKEKDQAILQNPSASFMVKSSHNNGGKAPNARLCSRDEREEEGEDGCSLFVGLSPLVLG